MKFTLALRLMTIILCAVLALFVVGIVGLLLEQALIKLANCFSYN